MTAAAIIDHAVRASARMPRERPLLFSAPMVVATLEGRKTVTRRLKGLDFVNERPGAWRLEGWADGYPDGKRRAVFRMEEGPREPDTIGIHCPFGQAGDRLWPKETYALARGLDGLAPSDVQPADRNHHAVHYLADGPKPDWAGKTRVSIHMTRWCSRALIELTDVRVERVQAISREDAIAEGLFPISKDGGRTIKYGIPDRDGFPGTDDIGWPWPMWDQDPRVAYERLWDSINPHAPWSLNPWCWVLSFRLLDPSTAHPKGT